ncbi:hypothetical protein BJY52DRAFT_1226200 [Lactarius psammicola]|nr:hypothetical protein BJY52DRAFT_1226200 [Lactarius psammicola]
MSDSELEDALSEHKKTRLLLPARLTPGLRGKLAMSEFCRRYELPEDIPSVLAQLRIKDAHALSRVYLRELRDKGMALRSINMLQLAVIRFSSESTPIICHREQGIQKQVAASHDRPKRAGVALMSGLCPRREYSGTDEIPKSYITYAVLFEFAKMVATSTPLRDEYCKGGEPPGVSIITGDAGDCAKSGLVRCYGQVGFGAGQACRDKRPRSRSRIRVNTGLLVTALVAMCM